MISARIHDEQLLRKLVEAAGQRQSAATPQGVAEFDWDSPCCFTPAQVASLKEFGDKTGKRLAQALSKLLRTEISLDPIKVYLSYGKTALAAMKDAEPFFVPLAEEGQALCGCIIIPGDAANRFVSKFLGATGDSATPGRKLSPLEQELLADVVKAAVNEFSAELTAAGGKAFRDGQINHAEPAGMETAECCCFALGDAGKGLPMLQIMLLCGFVESIFAASGLAAQKISAQEAVKRLTEHVGNAPVTASVWAGQAEIAMKDVLALEAGDVLILSTQLGQAMELMVEGRPMAFGAIAEDRNHYALQISGRLDNPTPGPAAEKSGKV